MAESLKAQIVDLGETISSDIHHGECFYDEEGLAEFINNLEQLKKLAKAQYQLNNSED